MNKKAPQPKIHQTRSRTSLVAGYNLGKGHLDRWMDQSHLFSTTLTPAEKASIEAELRDWGYEYWEGVFRLGKASSPVLKNLFPGLRRALVRQGEVVIVRRGIKETGYYYLLAEIVKEEGIKQIQRNLAGQVVNLKVSYVNRPDLTGQLVADPTNGADFTFSDFVIFRNDSQAQPELRRGDHKIKQILKIEELFRKDLEVSRPRIIAYHPLLTTSDKAALLNKYFFSEANDLITIASLNEGDKPTLHNWDTDSKQSDLWENYIKSLTEWKRLNGIRTNTARKKERNLLDEVALVEEQFEALENTRYDALVQGLEECRQKWGFAYTLLKPDEVEEVKEKD